MSLADDLRANFLTGPLTDEQRAELAAAGAERPFVAGEPLFEEGRPAELLWILLDGEVELSRRTPGQTMVVATMREAGQWAGGLTAWGGSDASTHYRASGRAVTPGRCLTVPSEQLGALVEAWSPFAKHMIRGVYQTIRGIDTAARERESLVALGTLAAGLAHEINNPAAASLRAVESLGRACDYMMSALVHLAEAGVTADRMLAIDGLRVELQARPLAEVGGLETADREESIGMWIEDHDVSLAWQMAPVFAARGVDRAWLDEVEALVGDEVLGAALRWMSSAVGASALLTELEDATSRISHLVEDVKTYSQLDRAPVQRVDVVAGIESTMSMLAPRLREIEVVRAFDDGLPEIDGHGAELNQVWTNLIVNALDAIDGAGTLRVSARVDGDAIVVDVADTGPGIDANVLPHIFEPFYTTKDVGKGTGLGLDISRRIVVDRHGGDISYTSEPGATVATVRLPIRLPDRR